MLYRDCTFYKLKFGGNLALNKSVSVIFSNSTCSLHVSELRYRYALTIVIVLGHHFTKIRWQTSVINVMYVLTVPLTADILSPVCFSFLELLYALRHNDNEMASECSRKRKNCRFLTLNQKLDMIKLSEEGTSKAKTG